MENVSINLEKVLFTHVTLDITEFDNDKSLNLSVSATELLEKSSFGVQFKMKIVDHNFILEIVAVAHFNTDVDIDKKFLNSSFAKINAPAIAYPYIRSYISNLTLNSGLNPVMLPSINFVKLAGKQ